MPIAIALPPFGARVGAVVLALNLGVLGYAYWHRPLPPPLPVTRCVVRPLIEPLAPHFFRVQRRSFVQLAARDLSTLRLIPLTQEGVPMGVALYGILPSSGWARLGFRNGDRIERVNGVALTSPDEALKVYAQLRTAHLVRVNVRRRCAVVHLLYELVD